MHPRCDASTELGIEGSRTEMMLLYYAPGACSLAPHIVLLEAGLPFDTVQVSLNTHKTKAGNDFYAINPKGYVPALELADGSLLTETAVISQYIADLVPEKRLAPAAGTLARYRLQETLNFLATELHKSFSTLFSTTAPDDYKAAVRARLHTRLALLAHALETSPFLAGEDFTVADAYLFTVLRWARKTHVDTSSWPSIAAFVDRVASRPAVRAALEAEGLLRSAPH